MVRRRFRRGDHVSWDSEAGRVSGRITRVVVSEIEFKGYTVHASEEEPQYEIKSDKTDHIAMHKGSALKKVIERKQQSGAGSAASRRRPHPTPRRSQHA